MPKVDPETHQMLDDSPDTPDDSRRGGKETGDPALDDATETGGNTWFESDKPGRKQSTDPGPLPGEKPVRD